MRAICSSLGFLPGVICKYYDWLTITKELQIVDILGQEGVTDVTDNPDFSIELHTEEGTTSYTTLRPLVPTGGATAAL